MASSASSHARAASCARSSAARLALAAATAVGFLAPPISGDAVGILFSAQVSALFVPAVTFTGVALFSLLVSAPAWIVLRRRAGRARVAQPG